MHNEIRDFYAHMALTHERHFARCFCRYSGNIAMRYFLHNKKKLDARSKIRTSNFFISFFFYCNSDNRTT